MRPRLSNDIEAALHALEVFHGLDEVVELRIIIGANRIDAGYFNLGNGRALRKALGSINGEAEGVYFVLNKLDPALQARADNRIKRLKHTTADANILERLWLYLDVDPVRPAGISSTDEEHQAAIDRAERIKEFLADRGWPEPVVVDSGNGCHLYYLLQAVPLDADGDRLVKAILEAIAAKFNDDRVKVDTVTDNRSRIAKLPGTVARKGDPTFERPHRRSKILEEPERPEPVPLALLEQLAAEAPQREKTRPNGAAYHGGRSFDIDAWLAAQSRFEIIKAEPYGGCCRWTLRNCPFNAEHSKPVIIELAGGALVYKCLHKTCAENDWHALRNLIDSNHTHSTPRKTTSNRRRGRATGESAAGWRPVDETCDYDLLHQPYTDTGNAERLVALYGHDIRFCSEMKKWLVWDGRRWNSEDSRRVKMLAKRTVRQVYVEATAIERADIKEAAERHARKSESSAASTRCWHVPNTKKALPSRSTTWIRTSTC